MLVDIKSAMKNALIYGLSNFSIKLVGLILLPLFSTHLKIEEYGVLAILEVTSQILITVFSLSLHQAFFRWYYDKNYADKQKSLFFTVMATLAVIAVFMVVSLSFATGWFSNEMFNNTNYSVVLRIMLISTAFEIVFLCPNNLMRLQEKPVLFSSVNITKLAVNLSLTIFFVAHLNMKVEGIYIAQLISQFVYFLLLSVYITKNISPVFNKTALFEMLAFSFPLIFSSIATNAINLSDRYILTLFGTLRNVGQYSLGFKMANTINILIVSSVNMAIIPMMYRKIDSPDRYRFYSKMLTYYAFGLMFFVLGLSFFGKEVIKVLARNPNYWNSYIVIPFISFAVMFMSLKDLVFIGLQITKKTRIIAAIVISTSILNIILEVIFVKLFDTIGAAIATLVSQIIYFSLTYYWAQKFYKVPYELKKIIYMLIVGAFLYAIAYLCNEYSLTVRLITKSLLILAFPVILYLIKFYEPVEIRSIKNGWKKWRNPFSWKNNIVQIFNK